MTRYESAALILAALILLPGCGSQSAKPRTLTPEAFVAPRAGNTGGGTGQTYDAPSATATGSGGVVGAGERAAPGFQIPANQVNLPLPIPLINPAPDRQNPDTTARGTVTPVPRTGVSDVVENEIRSPRNTTTAPAGTPRTNGAAATTPPANGAAPVPGKSTGQYLTLGGVVADVNGTPIYANKVLSLIDPILAKKAEQLAPPAFKRAAAEDIRRTIGELIRNELEYAAAQRSLDEDDRRLADAATIYWRIQQITQAGGSVELAKRNSLNPRDPADVSMDFDDRVEEHRRVELIKIYYQKKVYPKIQVNAGDLREYYDKNVNKEFNVPETVKFRVVAVDVQKTGGKEAAITKVNDKYKRTRAGEDFAEMARKENDDSRFAGADAMEMAPASMALVKVRQALAKLQPGEVSDIVEDGQSFYVVKLEERKGGRVRAFEEQKVQDEIRFKLRSEQFRVLREREQNNLVKGAVITTSEQMQNLALDMAVQKYGRLAAK